jgi:hypothetical protein
VYGHAWTGLGAHLIQENANLMTILWPKDIWMAKFLQLPVCRFDFRCSCILRNLHTPNKIQLSGKASHCSFLFTTMSRWWFCSMHSQVGGHTQGGSVSLLYISMVHNYSKFTWHWCRPEAAHSSPRDRFVELCGPHRGGDGLTQIVQACTD